MEIISRSITPWYRYQAKNLHRAGHVSTWRDGSGGNLSEEHSYFDVVCGTRKWSPESEQAFNTVKEKLSQAPVLAHYDPAVPLRLAGDASANGLGAVLSHIYPDGTERPIAYASRTLTSSERNYAQLEREALSLVFGIKKFHQYLYGREFQLLTDHKPLTTILGPKTGIPSLAAARLQRWALLLSAYKYQIQYKPTQAHSNADGLSRLPLKSTEEKDLASMSTLFNIHQIAALPVTAKQIGERRHPILSRVLHHVKYGWPTMLTESVLNPYWSRRHEITVEQGCLLWGIRMIVPQSIQHSVLEELHQSHSRIVRMKAVARSYVWWPGLDGDLETQVKNCKKCQSYRSMPAVAPLHPWLWPSQPWERIHIDFAGPVDGNMILVIVDAHSKWPEAFLMSSTTSQATIRTLRHLFTAYGLPQQLVSDNGPQFASQEFATFLAKNGVKHIRSSPCHPSTNGLAERFVRTLKQALRKSNLDDPHQKLSNFLLAYRSTPHATTNTAPSELFLHRNLRTRLDLLRPDLGVAVSRKQAVQKETHDLQSRSREFLVGERVLVRNMRNGFRWLLGTVVERKGPLSYLVQVANGVIWKRHVNHLLKCSDSPQEERENSAQDIDESSSPYPLPDPPRSPLPDSPTCRSPLPDSPRSPLPDSPRSSHCRCLGQGSVEESVVVTNRDPNFLLLLPPLHQLNVTPSVSATPQIATRGNPPNSNGKRRNVVKCIGTIPIGEHCTVHSLVAMCAVSYNRYLVIVLCIPRLLCVLYHCYIRPH